MDDINNFFEKKLSKSLIYEQIYPYIYKFQPKYLLEDLKDLTELIKWLADYYQDFYCYEIFHRDLIRYLEGNESLDMDRVFQYENNIQNMPISKNWQVIFKRKFKWLILTDKEENYIINEAFNSFLILSPAITYRYKTRRQALQRNINDPKLLTGCRNILALMTENERTFFVNYVVTRDGGAKLDKFRYLMDSICMAQGTEYVLARIPEQVESNTSSIAPTIQETDKQDKKNKKRKRKRKRKKKEIDTDTQKQGGLAKLVAFGS